MPPKECKNSDSIRRDDSSAREFFKSVKSVLHDRDDNACSDMLEWIETVPQVVIDLALLMRDQHGRTLIHLMLERNHFQHLYNKTELRNRLLHKLIEKASLPIDKIAARKDNLGTTVLSSMSKLSNKSLHLFINKISVEKLNELLFSEDFFLDLFLHNIRRNQSNPEKIFDVFAEKITDKNNFWRMANLFGVKNPEEWLKNLHEPFLPSKEAIILAQTARDKRECVSAKQWFWSQPSPDLKGKPEAIEEYTEFTLIPKMKI